MAFLPLLTTQVLHAQGAGKPTRRACFIPAVWLRGFVARRRRVAREGSGGAALRMRHSSICWRATAEHRHGNRDSGTRWSACYLELSSTGVRRKAMSAGFTRMRQPGLHRQDASQAAFRRRLPPRSERSQAAIPSARRSRVAARPATTSIDTPCRRASPATTTRTAAVRRWPPHRLQAGSPDRSTQPQRSHSRTIPSIPRATSSSRTRPSWSRASVSSRPEATSPDP